MTQTVPAEAASRQKPAAHTALKTVCLLVLISVASILMVLQNNAPRLAPSLSEDAPETVSMTQDLAVSQLPQQERDPTLFMTGLENLPHSFRGTEPDGALRSDAQGNLIIHHEVRLLFDYFLAGMGEEPLAVIEARIRAYIQSQLPEPAATQASDLLARYLTMQRHLSTLDKPASAPDSDLETIAEQLQRIAQVRHDFLSLEAADAFFGDEETYDRITLDKMRVTQNELLSPEEKAQQIEALDLQLPEELQLALRESQTLVDLQRINQTSGSDAERQQARTERLGDAAAERLAQLDTARAHWNDRVQHWLAIRRDLLRNPQLSQTDKLQQLADLRIEYFTRQEQRRVEALERIQDPQGTAAMTE